MQTALASSTLDSQVAQYQLSTTNRSDGMLRAAAPKNIQINQAGTQRLQPLSPRTQRPSADMTSRSGLRDRGTEPLFCETAPHVPGRAPGRGPDLGAKSHGLIGIMSALAF